MEIFQQIISKLDDLFEGDHNDQFFNDLNALKKDFLSTDNSDELKYYGMLFLRMRAYNRFQDSPSNLTHYSKSIDPKLASTQAMLFKEKKSEIQELFLKQGVEGKSMYELLSFQVYDLLCYPDELIADHIIDMLYENKDLTDYGKFVYNTVLTEALEENDPVCAYKFESLSFLSKLFDEECRNRDRLIRHMRRKNDALYMSYSLNSSSKKEMYKNGGKDFKSFFINDEIYNECCKEWSNYKPKKMILDLLSLVELEIIDRSVLSNHSQLHLFLKSSINFTFTRQSISKHLGEGAFSDSEYKERIKILKERLKK